MKSQKILFFFTVFILITVQLRAQAPDIEWQNTIGGSNTDKLYSICATDDGGSILGGYSYSNITGDKTETNQGSDYWIVKLNPAGNIEWQSTLGGSYDERTFGSIWQTEDGGYIVGGTSESNISGDKTQICRGAKDYWIVKLDASGNKEWDRTAGGTNDDILQCVIQTSDGGYLAGGYSSSGISLDKTKPNIGMNDYWIVKLNSSGDIEWDKTIGGTSIDELSSMAQTSDGGYILGGGSLSGISGHKTEASLSNDVWVIKLSPSGNIEWQNTIGGDISDGVTSIAQTADGGYITAGYSTSGISGDKTEACIGGPDYWILKLSSTGDIEWQNTIGGSLYDNLTSLVKTADGGYLAGGYSLSGISGDKTEPHYGIISKYDLWIVKLNAAGNIEWQKSIAGKGDDILRSVAQSTDGGYLLGGFSNSPIAFDKTEDTNGDYDYWVIKLNGVNCSVPSSLLTDHITTTSAKIHWSVSSPADKYIINYREDDDALPWIQLQSMTTAKNLSGLLPATTYQFKVKSKCGSDVTDFSPVSFFTTSPLKEPTDGLSIFDIYPNPAHDKISIAASKPVAENTVVTISTMTGKVINVYTLTGESGDIDISAYAAGIYIVQMHNINGNTIQKFVKN